LISGRIAVEVELDSAALARRLSRSIAELYGIQSELTVVKPAGFEKPVVTKFEY